MAVQIIMVALLIGFPGLVTGELSDGPVMDPAKVQINVPTPDASGDEPPPVMFK